MNDKNGYSLNPVNVLNQNEVIFTNPLKDVHAANQIISGCTWIKTTEGVVLIDTLLTRDAAKKVFEKIKGTLKYIIYTHGHKDHVGGSTVFMSQKPEIVANKYLVTRLDKYKMLASHEARIASQQFNIPEVQDENVYLYPTKTFLGEMSFKLGDKTFELYSERAETDDACWVYVPELATAFVGDLLIGSFPNVGNPWKPARFALDWVKALENIRAKNPKYVFYGGNFFKGKRALKALEQTSEAIRALHNQIIDLINEDIPVSEMIHRVKLPNQLEKSPYLKQRYSRPEFFVFNVYRWYHGYFDGNPAHLLPRPEKEVMKEICDLIGEPSKIIKRSRFLHDKGKSQLALQILDILIATYPQNLEARKWRIVILEKMGREDYCLMSRNLWYYCINQDKKYIQDHT